MSPMKSHTENHYRREEEEEEPLEDANNVPEDEVDDDNEDHSNRYEEGYSPEPYIPEDEDPQQSAHMESTYYGGGGRGDDEEVHHEGGPGEEEDYEELGAQQQESRQKSRQQQHKQQQPQQPDLISSLYEDRRGELELVLAEEEDEEEEETLGDGHRDDEGTKEDIKHGARDEESEKALHFRKKKPDEGTVEDKTTSNLDRRFLTQEGKLFVGALDLGTTTEGLKAYFEKFGELLDVIVMREPKSGRSRGFGFVTFADPDVADRVLTEKHVIDGKVIDPKRAVPRGEVEEEPRDSRNFIDEEYGRKIFIVGITQATSVDDLTEFFSRFGPLEYCALTKNKDTGQRKTFAFALFKDKESAVRVLQQPHVTIAGQSYDLMLAEPKRKDGTRKRRVDDDYQLGMGSSGGRDRRRGPIGTGGMTDDRFSRRSRGEMSDHHRHERERSPRGYGSSGASDRGRSSRDRFDRRDRGTAGDRRDRSPPPPSSTARDYVGGGGSGGGRYPYDYYGGVPVPAPPQMSAPYAPPGGAMPFTLAPQQQTAAHSTGMTGGLPPPHHLPPSAAAASAPHFNPSMPYYDDPRFAKDPSYYSHHHQQYSQSQVPLSSAPSHLPPSLLAPPHSQQPPPMDYDYGRPPTGGPSSSLPRPDSTTSYGYYPREDHPSSTMHRTGGAGGMLPPSAYPSMPTSLGMTGSGAAGAYATPSPPPPPTGQSMPSITIPASLLNATSAILSAARSQQSTSAHGSTNPDPSGWSRQHHPPTSTSYPSAIPYDIYSQQQQQQQQPSSTSTSSAYANLIDPRSVSRDPRQFASLPTPQPSQSSSSMLDPYHHRQPQAAPMGYTNPHFATNNPPPSVTSTNRDPRDYRSYHNPNLSSSSSATPAAASYPTSTTRR
jgi:heterogeneous nuclear ribonucleoprotein A1/A3